MAYRSYSSSRRRRSGKGNNSFSRSMSSIPGRNSNRPMTVYESILSEKSVKKKKKSKPKSARPNRRKSQSSIFDNGSLRSTRYSTKKRKKSRVNSHYSRNEGRMNDMTRSEFSYYDSSYESPKTKDNLKNYKSALILTLNKLDKYKLKSFNPEENDQNLEETIPTTSESGPSYPSAYPSMRTRPPMLEGMYGLSQPLPYPPELATKRPSPIRITPTGVSPQHLHPMPRESPPSPKYDISDYVGRGPSYTRSFKSLELGENREARFLRIQKENLWMRDELEKKDAEINKLNMNMRLLQNNIELLEAQLRKTKTEKNEMERFLKHDIDSPLALVRKRSVDGIPDDVDVGITYEHDDVFVQVQNDDKKSLERYLEKLEYEDDSTSDEKGI